MKHPVDRLFGGIFLAVFVTVAVMVLLTVVPLGNLDLNDARIVHVLLGVLISACIVLPRTLLLRTLWHGRNPFILDEELNNMLIGRGIGLLCGAAAGMFVLGKLA